MEESKASEIVSPINLTKPVECNTKITNEKFSADENAILQDWQRTEGKTRFFINNQPLASYQYKITDKDVLLSFFRNVILNELPDENKKTQAVECLKKYFHQGGLLNPISAAYVESLMMPGNLGVCPLSDRKNIYITTTKTGFSVEEQCAYNKIVFNGCENIFNIQNLVDCQLGTDTGPDLIISDGKIDVNFSENASSPKLTVEVNKIQFNDPDLAIILGNADFFVNPFKIDATRENGFRYNSLVIDKSITKEQLKFLLTSIDERLKSISTIDEIDEIKFLQKMKTQASVLDDKLSDNIKISNIDIALKNKQEDYWNNLMSSYAKKHQDWVASSVIINKFEAFIDLELKKFVNISDSTVKKSIEKFRGELIEIRNNLHKENKPIAPKELLQGFIGSVTKEHSTVSSYFKYIVNGLSKCIGLPIPYKEIDDELKCIAKFKAIKDTNEILKLDNKVEEGLKTKPLLD